MNVEWLIQLAWWQQILVLTGAWFVVQWGLSGLIFAAILLRNKWK